MSEEKLLKRTDTINISDDSFRVYGLDIFLNTCCGVKEETDLTADYVKVVDSVTGSKYLIRKIK